MKFLLSSTMLLGVALADDWAVIVAGSKSYMNYRHQADACHAVNVVLDYGIPASNVITMIYDDVADNKENHFRGKLFNKPTEDGTPGVDVYDKCKIDYKGKDVTPDNFVAVLTGDADATEGKPVLKSTEQDRVFVNFIDHGGTGIIAFPNDLMYAKQLNDALAKSHSKGMYKEMVFYMEACNSGSMFENMLNSSLGIYVTTAANAKESSWGTYCPPDDKVDGVVMNTCLGDLYSVNWMENAVSAGERETLSAQYDIIKKTTNKSHVMQYGDMSFLNEPIGDFIGNGDVTQIFKKRAEKRISNSDVKSPDIPIHLAYYKYLRADTHDFAKRQTLAKELQAQLTRQMAVDNVFHDLAEHVATSFDGDDEELFHAYPAPPIVCDACCDALYDAFTAHCGGFDDYSLQFSRVIVNVCNHVKHEANLAAKMASHVQQLCKAM